MAEDVRSIAVIGAGTMGSQIALQAALSGFDTRLCDVDAGQLGRALGNGRRLLERRREKGQLAADAVAAALDRLWPTTERAAAVQGAGLVIEAVFEDLAAKRAVFAELDRLCPPEVVLASNSSSIGNSAIASGTTHTERAINMHFFHPVLVMRLVEVVPGAATSPQVVETTLSVARRLGKEPVLVRREVAGFVVNRILQALMREAMWLAEEGYARPEDIDTAVRLGLNHPMGPFELADFSGLDITLNAWRYRQEAGGTAVDRPPAILEERVRRGLLGRKSGQGFYRYGPDGKRLAADAG